MKKKALSKNAVKIKKERISIYDDGDEKEEVPEPKLEINKDLLFNNYSDVIAKEIFEKIMKNVFIEINVKNIYSYMGNQCSNYLFKEINALLSLLYICYEKENSFPSGIEFNDNYLRYESTLDEFNIPQPSSPLFDRWKIHRMNVSKTNNTNPKMHERRKSKGMSYIRKGKSKSVLFDNRNMSLQKSMPNTQRNEKNYEYIDVIEKAKMQREGLRLFDSFPSFPIAPIKPETYLTKEEEAQVESLREEILKKEEMKKKEDAKKRRFQFLQLNSKQGNDHNEKDLQEKNKYRGKNIAVTANGEIVFIQNINTKNLKSEFLQISSNMKNDVENSKRTSLNNNPQKKTEVAKMVEKKEIEKNKEIQENNDFYKESDKNKINQQIIIGGSSFNNFVPEIGVNLRQGKDFKSGGNDFVNKYNKISYEQFQKTLEMFKKVNVENNELLGIKNENETLPKVKSRNNKIVDLNNNNNNNTINNLNKSNNISNSNLTMRRNSTLYNFNLSNNVNKDLGRSSSLPDLFKSNFNTNMNNNSTNNTNNDLMLKQFFNYTNYNNSNFNINNSTKYNNYNSNNMSNLIKTSSSFKNILFNNEVKNNDNNNIDNNISATSTNFFLSFNKSFKISKKQKALISLKKMETFNSEIVKDNNWGIISQENELKNYKIPFINVMKNSLDKNILRVRSNINEIYTR